MTKSILTAFSTGEISPELASSTENPRAGQGLVKCENMIVDARGGVKSRPGTQYIEATYNTAEQSRLIPFQFNTEQAYVLEFGNFIMRVIQDDILALRDLVDPTYKWTLSSSGTSEYHLELAAGGDPELLEPGSGEVYDDGNTMIGGFAGSLNARQWAFDDNDTLGYDTIYVRLTDSTDPDTKAQGYIQTTFIATTPYPIAAVANINGDANSADTLYLFHPNYRMRKVTRISASAWTITEITDIDGPYKARVQGYDENIRINAALISGTVWELTADTAIFGDTEVDDPIRLGFPVPGDLTALYWSWFVVSTVTSDTVIRASLQGDDRIVYQQVANPLFKTGTAFWTEITALAGKGSLSYDFTNQRAVLTDDGVNDAKMEQSIITFSQVNQILSVNIAALTGTSPRVTIKVGTTSGASDILSVTPILAIGSYNFPLLPTADFIYISFDTVGSAASDTVEIDRVELFSAGDEPVAGAEHNTTDWRLAAWNANHGFPEKGIIKDSRLICAVNFIEPQTIWPSELNNYESFAFNTPGLETDSFSFFPNTPQINGIDWLIEQNGLNAGTSNGVWKVFATTGGVITPTDVNIKIDSGVGTLNLKPLAVDNSIIHTPRGMSGVSELAASLEAQGYVPRDLTADARHLFDDRRIVRWAYARSPDSIIWCVLDNGQLLGCTYVREYGEFGIWAWHRHSTPLGEGFKDIAIIPNPSDDNIDDVYFVINRAEDGATPNYYIEKLSKRITSQTAAFGLSASGTPYDYRFLDSALTYDDPKTITGATQADPVVITSTAHGYQNADEVRIQNIKGMIELNNNVYKVANKTADTYELNDSDDNTIDGTAFTVYLTGGEGRFMDDALSGFSHLNDQTVTALGDGAVETGITVSSGAVILTNPASFVHIGIPYIPEIETVDIEIMGTQGRKKSATKADIYFKDTRGAEVSITSNPDVWWLISFDDEAFGEDPPPLLTDSKEITLSGNYRKKERIKVRGSVALPIEIKRIIPDNDYGG